MDLPRMIRNLWIYRRVIALAVLVGIGLWFVASHRDDVRVQFPFVGEIHSWSGVVMLVSAALGAAITWLVMTFRFTLREAREKRVTQAETAAGKSVSSGTETAAGAKDTRERDESKGTGEAAEASAKPRSGDAGKEAEA